MTRSLKSRYSLISFKISVTIILFSSFKLAYQLLKLTFLSTTSQNTIEPSPQAAEQRVPSGDHVIF